MRCLAILTCIAALAVALPALTNAEPTPAKPPWTQRKLSKLRAEVVGLRAENRDLRRIARGEFTRPGSHSLERAFLCIHRYEGAWDDPDAPYYGGLQMDLEFQRAYGSEFLRAFGTADHWPVSAQIGTAMRAWVTRGFYPWPNTARYCGLIG